MYDLWLMIDVSLGISPATRRIRGAVICVVLPVPRPATTISLFGSMMVARACAEFWYSSSASGSSLLEFILRILLCFLKFNILDARIPVEALPFSLRCLQ